MKVATRVNALTLDGGGQKCLAWMELHGKRLDATSQMRRVREMPPLVYGTLDLRAAYEAHVAGCKMNKGLNKPVLHAIVQFPAELAQTVEDRQKLLEHAVAFINQSHGGQAVFAARLDQDEEGLGTVDVFFSPRYEKTTKKGVQTWISTSRHGKLLAEKHRAVIERRHDGAFATRPRQIGIALQEELYAYCAREMALVLEPRKEKAGSANDRIETEVYKLHREAQRRAAEIEEQEAAARAKAEQLLQEAAQVAEATESERAALHAQFKAALESNNQLKVQIVEGVANLEVTRVAYEDATREIETEREASLQREAEREAAHAARSVALETQYEDRYAKRQAELEEAFTEELEQATRQGALAGAKAAARLIVGVFTGKAPELDEITRAIMPVVAPVIGQLARWWRKFKPRVEALPEEGRPEPPDFPDEPR